MSSLTSPSSKSSSSTSRPSPSRRIPNSTSTNNLTFPRSNRDRPPSPSSSTASSSSTFTPYFTASSASSASPGRETRIGGSGGGVGSSKRDSWLSGSAMQDGGAPSGSGSLAGRGAGLGVGMSSSSSSGSIGEVLGKGYPSPSRMNQKQDTTSPRFASRITNHSRSASTASYSNINSNSSRSIQPPSSQHHPQSSTPPPPPFTSEHLNQSRQTPKSTVFPPDTTRTGTTNPSLSPPPHIPYKSPSRTTATKTTQSSTLIPSQSTSMDFTAVISTGSPSNLSGSNSAIRRGKSKPEPLDLSPGNGSPRRTYPAHTQTQPQPQIEPIASASDTRDPFQNSASPPGIATTMMLGNNDRGGTGAISPSGSKRLSWFSHGAGEIGMGSPPAGRGAGRDRGEDSPYATLGRRIVTDPLNKKISRDSLASPSTSKYSSISSRHRSISSSNAINNLTNTYNTDSSVPLSAVSPRGPGQLSVASSARQSPSAFQDADGEVTAVQRVALESGMQGAGMESGIPRSLSGEVGVGRSRVSLFKEGDPRREALDRLDRLNVTVPDPSSPISRKTSSSLLRTPNHRSTAEFGSPSTPGPTDPRYLDRAGLMGLGELSTPRWTAQHALSPTAPQRIPSQEPPRSQSGYALSRRAQSISNSESYDSLAIAGQSPPMPSLPSTASARQAPTRKVSGPRMRVPSNPTTRTSSRLAPPPPGASNNTVNGEDTRVGLGVRLGGQDVVARSSSGLLDNIARLSPLDFSFDSDPAMPLPELSVQSQAHFSPSRKALPTSYTHTTRYSPQVAAGLRALHEREKSASSINLSRMPESRSVPFPSSAQDPAINRGIPASYSSPSFDVSGRSRVLSTDSETRVNRSSLSTTTRSALKTPPLGVTIPCKQEMRASSGSSRNLAGLATLAAPDLPTTHTNFLKQFGSTKDFSHLPPSPSTASISQFMLRESSTKGSFSPEDVGVDSPGSNGSPAFPFPTPVADANSQSTEQQRRRSQNSINRTPKRSSSKAPAFDQEEALRKLDGLAKPSMTSLRSRERVPQLDSVDGERSIPVDPQPRQTNLEATGAPGPTDKGDHRLSNGRSSGSKRASSTSTSPGTSWHSRHMSNGSTAPSSADLTWSGMYPRGTSQDGSDCELTSGDLDKQQYVPPVPALPKDVQSMGRRPMQKSQTLADLPRATSFAPVKEDIYDASREGTYPRTAKPALSISPVINQSLLSPNMPSSSSTFGSPDLSNSPSMGSVTSGTRRMSKKWSFSSALNLGFSKSRTDLTSPNGDEALSTSNRSPPMQSDGFSSQQGHFSEFGLRIPANNGRKASYGSVAESEESGTNMGELDAQAQTGKAAPPAARRTHSGIPFFRRSSSTSAAGGETLSSKASAATLHMEGSSGAGTLQVPQTKKKMLGIGIPSMLQKNPSKKDVLEARSGLENDVEDSKGGSGWASRKRGKTLTDGGQIHYKPAQQLPPMQMKELPASTVERVSSLRQRPSVANSLLPIAPDSSLRRSDTTGTPLSRSATQTFLKTGQDESLPSIQGSPSQHGPRSKPSASPQSADGAPPAATPTKIPRMVSKVTSPLPHAGYGDAVSQLSSSGTPVRSGLSAGSPLGRERATAANPVTSRQTRRDENYGEAVSSMGRGSKLSNGARGPSQHLDAGQAEMPRTEDSPSMDHTANNLPLPQGRKVSAPVMDSSANRRTLPAIPVSKSSSVGYAKPALPVSRTPSVAPASARASIAAPPQRRSDFAAMSSNLAIPSTLGSQRMTPSSSSPMLQSGRAPPALRQSMSPRATSPATTLVDEDELQGDEEMATFLRRQKVRKASGNWKNGEIDNFLDFPDPDEPSPATTPHAFIKSQFDDLSVYERSEILDYSVMWYAGKKHRKTPATMDSTHNNFGFDDDRGDYLIINGDHLAYRYEIQCILGKGSFGQVLQCRDHRTGQPVAIKIIRNKKRFHHQALTEIQILENLVRWDPEDKHYMIRMLEHFYFRGHLCIVTELLSLNLYELIKANGFVGFSTRLIRRFTVQMLASLQVMRSNRVIHCDLKPENILLRHPAKSGLKVIDFGSSCFEHEKVYTYIQSRFYRSPEIILGTNYGLPIDMWSLGCILAEMFSGFPIFPGENEQEQLTCIMEVMGVPEKHLIERSSRRKMFFETDGSPKPYTNSKGKRRRPASKTLSQVLKCDDDLFVDFITKCLQWDPEKRLKPGTALHHPWIQEGRKKVLNTGAHGMGVGMNSASSPRTTRQLYQPGSMHAHSTMIGSPSSSLNNNSISRHRSAIPESSSSSSSSMSKPRISESSPLSSRRLAGHNSYVPGGGVPGGGGSISQLPSSTRQQRAYQHQSFRSYAEPARAVL